MIWKELISTQEVDKIAEDSSAKPILVFKHSTRCSISSVAKSRMESRIDELRTWADVYLLNLIEHREVSNLIAEKFQVYHESPQVLLIEKGECVYDESHLAIQPDDLKSYSNII